MKLGEKLAKLRNNKGLTQKELADLFLISRSTYAQYETSNRHPDYDMIIKLANYYSVSTDYLINPKITVHVPLPSTRTEELMREAGYLHRENTLVDISKINNAWSIDTNSMSPVYTLGVIRAGEPMYAKENIEGTEWVPSSELNGGEYFYLRVKGNSMKGRIQDGDLVLVRCQESVENGEIAVIKMMQP